MILDQKLQKYRQIDSKRLRNSTRAIPHKIIFRPSQKFTFFEKYFQIYLKSAARVSRPHSRNRHNAISRKWWQKLINYYCFLSFEFISGRLKTVIFPVAQQSYKEPLRESILLFVSIRKYLSSNVDMINWLAMKEMSTRPFVLLLGSVCKQSLLLLAQLVALQLSADVYSRNLPARSILHEHHDRVAKKPVIETWKMKQFLGAAQRIVSRAPSIATNTRVKFRSVSVF